MIPYTNIYGKILSKEIVNNEYEYKIERENKLYTVYCPIEGRYDFNYKDIVYITYKRSKLFWGKKKIVLASKDLTEMSIISKKTSSISIIVDLAFYSAFSCVIFNPAILPKEIHSVGQLLFFQLLALSIFIAYFYSTYKFIKNVFNSFLFIDLFNKTYKKSEKFKAYKNYITKNFSVKERIINKTLNDDNKDELKKVINDMDYSSTEKEIISEIIYEPNLKINDIMNIDIKKIKKEIEAKKHAY